MCAGKPLEEKKPVHPPTAGNPDRPTPQRIILLVVLYATCSSSLSIVNKWAILSLPFPGIVTACQFFATAATVYGLGQLGVVKVEALEYDKLVKMAPINIIFYLAIFTNGKVLQFSTVETFIAFRSLTPLLVSGLDTMVRKEPAPSIRTICCLALIAAGSASYAYDDANFSVRGYVWACCYLTIIVTEMVYAKHITATIGLSTWGLVLYQNVIAVGLFPFASLFSGEFYEIAKLFYAPQQLSDGSPAISAGVPGEDPLRQIQPFAAIPVLVSCILGVGISFAGWGTRSAITATQFTVLGVACKLATVAINVVVWSHHAPFVAQLSIVMCIVASVLYQQSAKRDKLLRESTFKVATTSSNGSSPHHGVVVKNGDKVVNGSVNNA